MGARALLILQNLLFYFLIVILSIVYIPIVSVAMTMVALVAPRRFTMRRVRRAISWFGWLFLRCAWPFVKVEYRDLSPEDKNGPFIFVCNHRSLSDPILMACLPYECVQIVNVWPFKIPIAGFFAKVAGYLSVHEMTLERFFARVGKLLVEGVCIISFPEGTRSGSRQMGKFTSSIFRVAEQNRATIVPLAISGNENIPRKGSLVLHPGRILVHKLPAIRYEDYKRLSNFKLKKRVQECLAKHLTEIESEAI